MCMTQAIQPKPSEIVLFQECTELVTFLHRYVLRDFCDLGFQNIPNTYLAPPS